MELDTEYYYAFVLEYDFFYDEFKSSPRPECDLTYKFCYKIAQDYLKSDYFKDTSHSSYEMLEKYVHANKFKILKEYEKFIGAENIYFKGNKKVLEIGNRGEQPIALIEWIKGGRKEYVVAIGYIIDNDRISWSRGYYYMDSTEAKKDFNRAKNGEYLISKDREQAR